MAVARFRRRACADDSLSWLSARTTGRAELRMSDDHQHELHGQLNDAASQGELARAGGGGH
jgi:hypothetical protein